MNIYALTVCINYSEFLSLTIPRLKPFLKSWTIITDSRDDATAQLAIDNDLQLFRTNCFYADGANFNKGRALETARRIVVPESKDWLLLIDADILPEPGWAESLQGIEPGKIYGARRHQCDDSGNHKQPLDWIPDAKCEGYFQLFHMADSHIANLNPLIEMDWAHAGVYDSHLKAHWPEQDRVTLPFSVAHLGEKDNWHGRGNREAFLKMNHQRYLTGSYEQERIIIHE